MRCPAFATYEVDDLNLTAYGSVAVIPRTVLDITVSTRDSEQASQANAIFAADVGFANVQHTAGGGIDDGRGGVAAAVDRFPDKAWAQSLVISFGASGKKTSPGS